MKVVQVLTRSDNIGGSQVHVRDLSLELQNRGYSVWVLVGGYGPFFNQLKELGIPALILRHMVRQISPYRDWRAFWELRRELRTLKPDLVATHTSKAGWIGRIAAWSLGIPSVFTVHGWSFIHVAPFPRKKLYVLAERLAAFFCRKIITVSHQDCCFCLENKIAPAKKVITVYNGIPDAPYAPKEQKVPSPRWVMTARLEHPKNHLFLLKALAQLLEYNWQVDFVGDGPLKPVIEQWISSLKLQSRVRLLGARSDVPQILAGANGFVLMSDAEGLPLSILEGMRAGLPVIASDVGGIAEMISDGVNGFLIPAGDLNILTARLKTLFTDEKLRETMGLASRRKFLEQFNFHNMMDGTLTAYTQAFCGQKSGQQAAYHMPLGGQSDE